MKRRLNLAVALVHDPQVIFLDEPTAGVDPQSRNHIFERIEQLRGAGPHGRLHDALHGRGPAAVRPRGHHGSRQDSGSRYGARAARSLRRAIGREGRARAAAGGRRQAAGGPLDGLVAAVRIGPAAGRSRPAVVGRRRVPNARSHQAGFGNGVSYRSPAGACETDAHRSHHGGEGPAAHEPRLAGHVLHHRLPDR